MVAKAEKRILGGETPTNGAKAIIESGLPYTAHLTIEGAADFLFHRWNCEAVDAKSKAAKGSKAKKSDDIESYVYRVGESVDSNLAIPGEYIRQSVIYAAKYRQDPRSPRKSAMDLFKAGVVAMSNLCDLGSKNWDYEDSRRVVIQRNGVTRTRPALRTGWTIQCDLMVLTPEYISPALLHEVLTMAGKLIGVGDYRPTFGRYAVTKFECGLTD